MSTIYVCIYVRTYACIFQPLRSGTMNHKVNFYVAFNRFEFKATEPNIFIYSPIAVRGIIGFIPFPRVLVLFTNPSARAGYDTRSIFKRSLAGLNSEFSFSETSRLTKAEEPSLSCYLPIAGGRIIGFIPFPRVLVLCEMQSVSSRIWTRVAVSISCDDNHYTTGTSQEC